MLFGGWCVLCGVRAVAMVSAISLFHSTEMAIGKVIKRQQTGQQKIKSKKKKYKYGFNIYVFE